MKANKLMIGDLVKCGDILILISRINESSASGVDLDALEPIPITLEMLMDNEFNENISPHFMKFHWTTGGVPEFYDIDIIVGKDQKDKWRWDSLEFRIHYWRGEILMYKKQYVHELQHALRLVGLNTLADNFKINKL